jgi:hypothetical protein
VTRRSRPAGWISLFFALCLGASGAVRAQVEARTPARSAEQVETTAQQRLAVMPITGAGLLLDDLFPIERAIRDEILRLGVFRVLDRDATLAELQGARRMGLDCRMDDVGCLTRLGLVGELDVLLVPAATRQGRLLRVSLRLIDVRLQREVARVVRVMEPRALDASAARMIDDLLDMDPALGSVALDISEAGAVVFVDGEEAGTAPLEGPLTDLEPGPHELEVKKPGFRSMRATIDVQPRSVRRYVVRLAREGERPAPVVLVSAKDPEAPALPTRPLDAPDQGTLVAGAATASLGAVVAVAAGVAFLALDEVADTAILTETERENTRLASQGLIVVAAGGALFALGGAALVGVELVE